MHQKLFKLIYCKPRQLWMDYSLEYELQNPFWITKHSKNRHFNDLLFQITFFFRNKNYKFVKYFSDFAVTHVVNYFGVHAQKLNLYLKMVKEMILNKLIRLKFNKCIYVNSHVCSLIKYLINSSQMPIHLFFHPFGFVCSRYSQKVPGNVLYRTHKVILKLDK